MNAEQKKLRNAAVDEFQEKCRAAVANGNYSQLNKLRLPPMGDYEKVADALIAEEKKTKET